MFGMCGIWDMWLKICVVHRMCVCLEGAGVYVGGGGKGHDECVCGEEGYAECVWAVA